MWKLESCQIQKITPKRASSLLLLNYLADKNGEVVQRIIHPGYVKLYAEQMREERFRVAEIAVAKSLDRGKTYLANGQHTLKACKLADCTITAAFATYTCNTDEDLYRLFSTFDVHRARSDAHVMKAARPLLGDERLKEVSLALLSRCASALSKLRKDDTPLFALRFLEKGKKPELVQKCVDEVMIVADYGNDYKHINRVGITMAMIETFRINPKAAREWWDYVVYGEGGKLPKQDPKRRLRDALFDQLMIAKHRIGSRTNADYYKLCILWWNSWRTNRPRKTAKLGSIKKTPRVEG